MSLTFQLGIDSGTAVTILPEYDYEIGKKQIRSEHRTRGGKLYVYKWGDYCQIKFSAEYVPASVAIMVNSWWDTNTQLLWFVTSGANTDVFSVMITNKETPLQKFNAPYAELYKGKIELEGY